MSISLRVLIGCETSGVMRNAFLARGHDAWSCDLLPAVDRSNRQIVAESAPCLAMAGICWPSCTRPARGFATAVCGGCMCRHVVARKRRCGRNWRKARRSSPIAGTPRFPRVAVENPIMHRHARERIRNYQAPAQVVTAVALWRGGVQGDVLLPSGAAEAGADRQARSAGYWNAGA